MVSSVLVLRQIYSAAPVVTSLTEGGVELMTMLEWSVKVGRALYMWQIAIHTLGTEKITDEVHIH